MPYVFYDTETTGIETTFDQILQFAAIRTDDDLNELERFNIRCRLLPHIIPSPIALQVTHVTPTMLTDSALPSHYEMIRQIRDTLLAWSPATWNGTSPSLTPPASRRGLQDCRIRRGKSQRQAA